MKNENENKDELRTFFKNLNQMYLNNIMKDLEPITIEEIDNSSITVKNPDFEKPINKKQIKKSKN